MASDPNNDLHESKSNMEKSILIATFQENIKQTRLLLDKIKLNTQEINRLKSEYSQATRIGQEKGISDEIEMIITSNTKLTQEVKQKMDVLSQEMNNSKKESPDSDETSMKDQLYKSLAFSVKQTLEESQNSQLEYKNGLKQKTFRQTKNLDANLNEQQLNEICDDPDKVAQLFQQKLFNAPSIQLQNAVSDIQDKYKDILKLEKSVRELHQLLQDIALLVHQQGEMIDDIELHVTAAKKNVDKANQHLQKAKEHHLSAKKKYCCIAIIGLVIIIIILASTLS